MTHDEVIAKVQKLYALASSTNEHEAAAATAAAERIIQQYRLDAAELEVSRGAQAEVPEKAFLPHEGKTLPIWRNALIGMLCKNYGVASAVGRDRVVLFGKKGDVAIFRVMYERLVLQVNALAVANAQGRGRSYADSYRKGIVVTIGTRLAAAKTQVAQHGATAALARLDDRLVQSQLAMRQDRSITLRARSPHAVNVHGDAFSHGRRDGHQVHLGESLSSGPDQRLLGARR